MTKVSVIVPVYNVEKYLPRCLDSLLAQTLSDVEFICVNDGSFDNSEHILAEYAAKDKRVRIISQDNQGLSVARNSGIKAAVGEYIAFVDSDDWIDTDFLEKLYQEAKSTEADIAVASIYVMKKKLKKSHYKFKINKKKTAVKTEDKYRLCGIPDFCYVCNKIYRSSLVRQVLFYPGVYFEDIEFSHKIIHLAEKLVIVPGPKYYYFINPTSISAVRSDKKVDDYEQAWRRVRGFLAYNDIKHDLNKYYAPYEKVFNIFGIPVITIKKWEERLILCLGRKWKIAEIYQKNLHNYRLDNQGEE